MEHYLSPLLVNDSLTQTEIYISLNLITNVTLGHEASFIGLLCCLMKMRVFNEEDALAIALKLFNR